MALKTMSIAKLQDLKSKVEAAISARVNPSSPRSLGSTAAERAPASGAAGKVRWLHIPQPREPSRDLGRPWPQAPLVGGCPQGRKKDGRFSDCRDAATLSSEATQEDQKDAQASEVAQAPGSPIRAQPRKCRSSSPAERSFAVNIQT